MQIDKPVLSFDYNGPEAEDIKRCLHALYGIRAGTQPLDRSFGLDIDKFLDQPLPIAKNAYALEVIEKTERYEPRVSVESVTFGESDEWRFLRPVIRIKRREDR